MYPDNEFSALQAGLQHGFVDADQATTTRLAPTLIANRDGNTMLRALRRELRIADSFTFSVAFVTPGAIATLKQELIDFDGRGVIITSDYLQFNSPRAFRELLALPNITTYIFQGDRASSARRPFHAKGYLFRQGDITTGIVGSSNLTQAALDGNVEWNLRVSALHHSGITAMLDSELEAQLAESIPLTESWVDEYARTFVPKRVDVFWPGDAQVKIELPEAENAPDQTPARMPGSAPSARPGERAGQVVERLRPNAMQARALDALQRLRDAGETRAVVISATGTGKTLLSAFDVRAVHEHESAGSGRMLFVVHREQILRRAMTEYQQVLDGDAPDFALYAGQYKNAAARYVFATVQSLNAGDAWSQFAPDAFDYIVIDEVHRSAAGSYQRILDHFAPKFLLGMTATPERTDGADIFRAFDYNTAYEIRLNEALETEMLCPFHYYGVTEYLTNAGELSDDPSTLIRLADSERAHYILRQIELHAQAGIAPKGIIFCSRNAEAAALSAEFNTHTLGGRPLRTAAVSGRDNQQRRDELVLDLREGRLDYLLTVDIFNEGIDIPEVNQIIMLRQTQSSIVFVQQLGRGLRKAPGKEYLVVVDFIGNYQNNYMIPIALFGDRSRNRDALRKQMRRAISEGTLSGLSTVSFDRIAAERVLASIDTARIDTKRQLLDAYRELRTRQAEPPRLADFAEAGAVDPVVLANGFENYARLLTAAREEVPVLPPWQDAVLTLVTKELLNGRRRAELVVLRDALARLRHDADAVVDLADSVADSMGPGASALQARSVGRVLDLSFFTQAERKKYGGQPLVIVGKATDDLTDAYLANGFFASVLDDMIATGLLVNAQRYVGSSDLVVGQKYGRKDALRVLNWASNEASTVYGYKVDPVTATCPIFVTYHKSDEIAETTRYEDAFVDERTFTWFSKSRRTLESKDVRQILGGEIALHLFVKKSDAEGTDFYYLGRATTAAAEAQQLTMPAEKGEVSVVRTTLHLEHAVDAGLYDFLTLELRGEVWG
ncbi:MAG: DEAD/DEAH box helicase [Pseudoclavibacter sp.]